MSYVVQQKDVRNLATLLKAYILRFQENLTTWAIIQSDAPGILEIITNLLNAGFESNSLSNEEAWRITQVWLEGGNWTGHGKGYDTTPFWIWHRIPASAEKDWPRPETAADELGKEYALSQSNPRVTMIKKVKARVRGLERPL